MKTTIQGMRLGRKVNSAPNKKSFTGSCLKNLQLVTTDRKIPKQVNIPGTSEEFPFSLPRPGLGLVVGQCRAHLTRLKHSVTQPRSATSLNLGCPSQMLFYTSPQKNSGPLNEWPKDNRITKKYQG